MDELTQEKAIELYESKFWETMTLFDRAAFQLFQDRLCMPFDVFHQAMEHALGRPVCTHEFADRNSLIREFLKEKAAPTFDEIMALIPEEKRIVISL